MSCTDQTAFVKCALGLLFLIKTASPQNAELRGKAVDTGLAAVSRTQVRLTSTGGASATFRSKTDLKGDFVIRDVPPGDYDLRFSYRWGFRPRTLTLKLAPGEVKDLGAVPLELAGCDAPEANCFYIDTVPPRGSPPPRIVSQGYITLGHKWGVDLDSRTVFQPEEMGPGQPAPGADVLLTQDMHSWTLIPVNGAAISKTDCNSAKFGTAPITVNGLDSGDEICVKTDLKNYSHIFVVDEIAAGNSRIQLWYVTH